MKLEVLTKNIMHVSLDSVTKISGDQLLIDIEELRSLLEEDTRFEKVDIFVVNPGDQARIINVSDVIQPRFRTDGVNFPGILGPVKTVGQGQTLVLNGVAVVETNPYFSPKPLLNGIIDTMGFVSTLTPYSQTHNVVLVCHPKDKGINRFEYAYAIKQASLKTAAYLAGVAAGVNPDYVESFDLPPTTGAGMANLPRVGYLQQLISLQFDFSDDLYSLREPFIYGGSPRGLLPITLHPNEILDGAMMPGYGHGSYYSLYSLQNSAIIKELYSRHGKDLCFVGGCIIVISPTDISEKERNAVMAANTAKAVLGLNGIILGREFAGASEADQVLQCEAMEAAGIKTVVISRGSSLKNTLENYVTVLSPKQDAVISCGNAVDKVHLPAIATVYGGDKFELLNHNIINPFEEMQVMLANIVDALSLTGFSPVTTELY